MPEGSPSPAPSVCILISARSPTLTPLGWIPLPDAQHFFGSQAEMANSHRHERDLFSRLMSSLLRLSCRVRYPLCHQLRLSMGHKWVSANAPHHNEARIRIWLVRNSHSQQELDMIGIQTQVPMIVSPALYQWAILLSHNVLPWAILVIP